MTKANEFTIMASGLDPLASDYEDRFFAAGCDDATLSVQGGCIVLAFARQAENLSRAIASAIADTRKAGALVEAVRPFA
jgi:hypothetical protein